MTLAPVLPESEPRGRLDGLLISVPENIYYLTGLEHWGFFACHVLIVPRDGEMALACRAMERLTVENQVSNARFYGHKDNEQLSDHVAEAIFELGIAGGRLGIEQCSLLLAPHHAEGIIEKAPRADWRDESGLLDDIRLIKSPLEISYTRTAATAADAGTLAAIEAIREGEILTSRTPQDNQVR